MKSLLILAFFILLLTSCTSTNMNSKRVQEKISSEQVRTLKEIQHHLEMILEAHPELSIDTKQKANAFLTDALEKQQLLKDEESKIVQLLLSKSISANKLTYTELNDKKVLKKRLETVYEAKANNIFTLVQRITEMSGNSEINKDFENDLQLFMRDIR